MASRWWPTSAQGAAIFVFSGKDGHRIHEILPPETKPTSRFRVAAAALRRDLGAKGNREYLDILQVAARESEVGVDYALRHLIARDEAITAAAVSRIVRSGDPLPPATAVSIDDVNLLTYDALLGCAG